MKHHARRKKTVNELVLAEGLWEIVPLSAASLAALQAVADQCPSEGGFAVYEARCVYRRYVPNASWDPEMTCTEQKPGSRTRQITENTWFKIMPNPANEKLELIAATPLRQPAQLQLANALGTLVFNGHLETGAQNFVIDTRGLANGVYFYKIDGVQGLLEKGVVVISH